jgi:hypothetical protein
MPREADSRTSLSTGEAYGPIGPAERGRHAPPSAALGAVIVTVVVPAWCVVAAVAILWWFWRSSPS